MPLVSDIRKTRIQQKIEYYLQDKKNKMFRSTPSNSSNSNTRYALQGGQRRSVSTKQRQRLAQKEPRVSSARITDFINYDFNSIVVVGRASRAGDVKHDRPLDLWNESC